MNRISFVLGFLMLSAAMAVGTGYSQDKQKDPAAGKATLPAGWSKIGLTADQKKKITTIRATYKAKIDDLKSQIDALNKEDYAECVKVLTDDQVAQLKKLATEKIDGAKDDKKKDEDKKK